MSDSFDDIMKKLRARIQPRPDERPAPQTETQPVAAINLGIDFGTSFTKVCFRDVGAEVSGVVRFGQEAIVGSIVHIHQDGRLSMDHHETDESDTTAVPYLKMHLAALRSDDGDPSSQEDRIACCALSAWFLANIIADARAFIVRTEAARLAGRRVQWSANLGVPVEHYDSPAKQVFEEVLRVAWRWAECDRIPGLKSELRERYSQEQEASASEVTDFHAIPEIAAAVHSFVMSREAKPDFYIYFDIGGGTVDGVAFKYNNDDGERKVDFYSGRVATLGMRVISDAAAREEHFRELQQLVATVILTAKRKDGRDWQREAIQRHHASRPRLGRLDERDMAPLIVFLGGYGANDQWYKKTIQRTYEDFQHRNSGVPPYQLVQAPTPGDLNITAVGADQFVRFAIAYGLSIPMGEGPEIVLPSEIPDPQPPPPPTGPDYRNDKDMYD